jgi:osmoprotectant transport system ATP-binding protein
VDRTAAVELRNVTKSYAPGRRALDGVSIAVEEGTLLALVGTSGSGKTTALRSINRLVSPDSGQVFVANVNVATADPVELRRRIGYVIQEVGLFPHLTIGANVELVPSLLGWPAQRRTERRRELLQLVGLPAADYEHRFPAELSGGERQRVGLARALAADPPLLLMDEPFSAVDALTRRRLQDEFRDLRSRLRKTVVLVTHDLPEAFRLADRVAVMDQGRLLQHGTPREIRDSPEPGFVAALVAAALDVPS